LTLAPLALLGVYFEVIPQNYSDSGWSNDFPMTWITEIMPVWLALAIAVAILIPGIIILLLGISVLVKKSIIDGRFGLVALGIWLLSLGICAFQVPRVVTQFKTEATQTVENVIDISEKTLILKSVDSRDDSGFFEAVSLKLQGTDNEKPILIQKLKSKGKSYQDALKNTETIKYKYTVMDSVLTFERGIDLNQMDKFRGQKIDLVLEIPYEKPFVLDKSILSIIKGTIHSNGYKIRDVNSRNHWVFNEMGLLCLTCSNDTKVSKTDSLSRAKFEGTYFMNR